MQIENDGVAYSSCQFSFSNEVSSEKKSITICPVSGGAFPVQLEALLLLANVDWKTDVYMGSSGGNIAVYLALAGNMELCGINRISSELNSSLMFEKWSPVLNFIPGFFFGSLYKASPQFQEYLMKYFFSASITRIEIWTGVYNRTKQKGQFFCNLKQKNSIFGNCKGPNRSANTMPLKYLNGNVKKIAQITQCSASIPALIEEQIIDGDSCCDGGLAFASPFTAFSSAITNRYDSYSLTYINCMDVESACCDNDYDNTLQNGRSAASELVKSSITSDRLMAINAIAKGEPIHFLSFSLDDLQTICEKRLSVKRSLLEIYPRVYSELDILNFTGEDVIQCRERARSVLLLRFYWVGDPNLFDQ